jgi:hypothetical protein
VRRRNDIQPVRSERGWVVTQKEVHLQLAYQITSHGLCQLGITLQTLFELLLHNHRVIDGDKMRSRNSKISDQHELPGYDIHDETELGLSRKCQGILGLQLDFAERFASSEEVSNHVSRTAGRKKKIAVL